MSNTLTASEPPTLGLGARVLGVIFSPRDTFAAVAARPKWLGVTVVTLALLSASYYVLMSNPQMQEAIIDQQLDQAAARGTEISDQQLAATEQFITRFLPPVYAVAIWIIGPIITAIVAGILMGIFSMMLGGNGTFRQVYALVAHAGVISTLSAVLMAAMLLAGVEPQGVRPPSANLGVFVPMLEDTSFVYIFLRTIDMILIWWMFTMAIGLGVLYKRRTGGIAGTLLGLYLTIALAVAFFTSGS